MSLDKFQSKYTSEDNASFDDILEKNQKELRKKFKWVFDAERQMMVLENKPVKLITDGESEEKGTGVDPKGFIESWDFKVTFL